MAAAEKGAALRPYRYRVKDITPFECRLDVLACGLCHSDIHVIDNDWNTSHYPLIPGHEVIGRVVEIGSAVTHLRVGDRVGVGWQRSACLQCDDCLRGETNLCDQSKSVITDGFGGFASGMTMDSRFVFGLSDGIATEIGGPLLCGGITVYSALRAAGTKSGQHIGVIGVGGLGHIAVQFASFLGNIVTAFTSSSDKSDFAVEMGADYVVVVDAEHPPRSEKKFDIIINTVPADLDWTAYINLLKSDGTLTFVGVPPSPLILPIGLLLHHRRRITASPIGGRAIMKEMLRIADEFGIAPVIEKFPLADVNKAIKKVRDNTIRYRAVIIP